MCALQAISCHSSFPKPGIPTFLLVPYVGACVHVPSATAQPDRVRASFREVPVVRDLFTPVWIEGPLKTKQSSKALTSD